MTHAVLEMQVIDEWILILLLKILFAFSSSFVQVKVGVHTAEGMGTNKKVAKRNAAENMLEILGFKIPQPQPPKPALKTEEKVMFFKYQSLFDEFK